MSLVLFSPIYCCPPSYLNLSSSSPLFFFSSLVISLAYFVLYSGRAFRNSFWLLLFYVGFDRLQRVITTFSTRLVSPTFCRCNCGLLINADAKHTKAERMWKKWDALVFHLELNGNHVVWWTKEDRTIVWDRASRSTRPGTSIARGRRSLRSNCSGPVATTSGDTWASIAVTRVSIFTHTQTQTCWNRLIFVLILMLSVSKAVGVARVSDLLYIFHVVLGVPLSLRVPFVLIVNVTFCLPFLRCVFDVICSDQRRSRICSTCYHFFYIYYDNDWGIQGRRGKVLNGRPSCRSSSCLFNRIVVDVSFFLSSF